MSQQSEYHAGERQLSLLGAISQRGLTRAQARRRIPAYGAYSSHDSFQRVFERDISALRAAGYPIAVDEEGVYRYDRSAPIIAPLSALDVGLVRSFLAGLGKGGGLVGAAHSGMSKILATSEADRAAPRYLRASVPSGEDVVPIARALQYRRRISFAYEGRGPEPSRYQLEPHSLAQHFDAFYVTGAARAEESAAWVTKTFRISRIISGSLSVDGPATEPASADPADAFTPVRAVLAVRPGAAAPLLAQGRKASWSAQKDGWDVIEIGPVNRQRIFDILLSYGKDVRLLADESLLREWRERLRHLVDLGAEA